jgi:hypothetical protein
MRIDRKARSHARARDSRQRSGIRQIAWSIDQKAMRALSYLTGV